MSQRAKLRLLEPAAPRERDHPPPAAEARLDAIELALEQVNARLAGIATYLEKLLAARA